MANKNGLKNRTPFANAMDSYLYKQLQDYSKRTMIPISRILDDAIKEYLSKRSKKDS